MDVNHCLYEYERLIRFIRPLLWGAGYDAFDPKNRRLNRRSVVFFIIATIFWLCLLYTLFLYRGNFIEFVKTASASGPIILVSAKVITLATNFTKIYEIHQEIIRLHLNSRDIYTKRLNIWTKRLRLTANFCMLLYFGTGVLFIFGPIAIYVMYDERMLVIPVQLPFIDVENWTGFLITSGYEILCSIYAVAILASVDSIFIAFGFTGAAYMDMVGLKCEALTDNIEKLEDKSSNITEKDVTNSLREIVIAGLAMDRVQVYMSGICLCLCLITATYTNWFVAYLLGASCLFGLTSYCAIGTLLELKCEELSSRIYNIKWYCLPLKDRKMFQMLLQHSQKSVCIEPLPSRIMNVELAMHILKNIYSLFMMMIEFV